MPPQLLCPDFASGHFSSASKPLRPWALTSESPQFKSQLFCLGTLCTSYYLNISQLSYFIFEKVKVKSLSCVRLFVTPWTVAHKAPLSIGFSRQEYWSGLPFSSPGDLPGIEPRFPTLQAEALTSEPLGKPKFGQHTLAPGK